MTITSTATAVGATDKQLRTAARKAAKATEALTGVAPAKATLKQEVEAHGAAIAAKAAAKVAKAKAAHEKAKAKVEAMAAAVQVPAVAAPMVLPSDGLTAAKARNGKLVVKPVPKAPKAKAPTVRAPSPIGTMRSILASTPGLTMKAADLKAALAAAGFPDTPMSTVNATLAGWTGDLRALQAAGALSVQFNG